MAKFFKWILAILFSFLLLVVLGIAALTMFIDPNRFKPDIINAAKQQLIALTLDGKLEWQFYPNLGIVIQQVSVAPLAQPEAPIARIEKAGLSVQLIPLFSGKVAINGIELIGLDAQLSVNEDGVGNWTQLMKKDDAVSTPHSSTSNPQNNFIIAIHQLNITQGKASYRDEKSHQQSTLSNFTLTATDIALDSNPFTFATSGDVEMIDEEQKSQTGHFDLNGSIAVNAEMTFVNLKNTKVSMVLSSAEQTQAMDMVVQMNVHVPTEKQILLVDMLDITEGNISQTNKLTKQNMLLSHLEMNSKTMAMNNLPFAFSAKGNLLMETIDKPKMTNDFEFSSQVSVDETMNQIAITQGKLVAKIGTEKGQGELVMDMQINAVKEPMSYSGSIAIAPFNARNLLIALGTELPEMQSKTALTHFALSADIAGTENTAQAKNMLMQLDGVTFSGEVSVTDIAKQFVVINMKGDKFNLDHYLAPQVIVPEGTVAAPPVGADEDPILIPLETIRPLQVDVEMEFNQLIAHKMPFNHFKMSSSAHDGFLTLKNLTANLYDGPNSSPLKITGSLDGRASNKADNAVIQFDISSKQLPMGQVLRDFAIDERVSGTVDIALTGKTQGLRYSELLKALDAKLSMTGKKFQVANINLEHSVCDLVALVERKEKSTQTWENYTQMRDMALQGNMKNGIATIESMEAGVEQIALKNKGQVNLLDKSFDMHLTLRLTDALAGSGKCAVNNKKLMNRDIPIRCKSSLDKIGPKTCLPDMSFIEKLAKDEFKEKASEKINTFLEDKAGDDPNVKAAKDLLKGLFKKK